MNCCLKATNLLLLDSGVLEALKAWNVDVGDVGVKLLRSLIILVTLTVEADANAIWDVADTLDRDKREKWVQEKTSANRSNRGGDDEIVQQWIVGGAGWGVVSVVPWRSSVAKVSTPISVISPVSWSLI